MTIPVVPIDDMYLDRVHYRVDWDFWEPGMSVFIPCIDWLPIVKHFRDIGLERGYRFIHKVVIENGMFGLRIWRIK